MSWLHCSTISNYEFQLIIKSGLRFCLIFDMNIKEYRIENQIQLKQHIGYIIIKYIRNDLLQT